MEEIKEGDLVRIKKLNVVGRVCSIKDYGTHICYFIDVGMLLKYPAKREWIELFKKEEG